MSTQRFLTYKPWPGELNNMRMQLETMVALAIIFDRTLIIPDSYRRMGLRDPCPQCPPVHPADVFDLDYVRDVVPILVEGIDPLPELPDPKRGECPVLELPTSSAVISYPRVPPRGSLRFIRLLQFAAGRPILYELEQSARTAPFLHVTPMLEYFYTLLFLPERTARRVKRAIRHAIRYKAEIEAVAEKAIGQLKNFNAVHVRRNTFLEDHAEARVTAETMCHNLQRFIRNEHTLYIATDERDRSFFAPLSDRYQVVFLRDLVGEDVADFYPEWVAGVEQLICVRAETFVGTRFSTYSSYITRLRGYAGAQDLGIYFTNGYSCSEVFARPFGRPYSWFAADTGLSLWVHEYREGWEF
jgi:hypothetical protein